MRATVELIRHTEAMALLAVDMARYARLWSIRSRKASGLMLDTEEVILNRLETWWRSYPNKDQLVQMVCRYSEITYESIDQLAPKDQVKPVPMNKLPEVWVTVSDGSTALQERLDLEDYLEDTPEEEWPDYLKTYLAPGVFTWDEIDLDHGEKHFLYGFIEGLFQSDNCPEFKKTVESLSYKVEHNYGATFEETCVVVEQLD